MRLQMPNTSYESRIKFHAFRSLGFATGELAETIVQYVAEIKKSRGERLPGYQEAQLDSLRLRLFSPAPIYPEFEKAKLAGSRSQLASRSSGITIRF